MIIADTIKEGCVDSIIYKYYFGDMLAAQLTKNSKQISLNPIRIATNYYLVIYDCADTDTYYINNYSYRLVIDRDTSASYIEQLHAKSYGVSCTKNTKTDYVSLQRQLNFGKMRFGLCLGKYSEQISMVLDRHELRIAGLSIFVGRNRIADFIDQDQLKNVLNNGYNIIFLMGNVVLFDQDIAKLTTLKTKQIRSCCGKHGQIFMANEFGEYVMYDSPDHDIAYRYLIVKVLNSLKHHQSVKSARSQPPSE